MVEEHQRRVTEHTNKIVEEIDKSTRKMRGDAYRCAASCCDDNTYSMRKVENCLKNCNNSWDKTQEYIKEEMERVQNRLQRCIKDCEDEVRDTAGPNLSRRNMDEYNEQLEITMNKCVTKCVDNYCKILPTLEKKIKNFLSE